MTFSNKILIGLTTGVMVGLFLGEYAAALERQPRWSILRNVLGWVD